MIMASVIWDDETQEWNNIQLSNIFNNISSGEPHRHIIAKGKIIEGITALE